MSIYDVLVKRYGDKLWELHEFEYDGLIWKDESPKPTKEELEKQESEVFYENELEKIKKLRHEAYTAPGGSDSLYMKYQRGEATKQEWLDMVNQINLLYPYPDPIDV